MKKRINPIFEDRKCHHWNGDILVKEKGCKHKLPYGFAAKTLDKNLMATQILLNKVVRLQDIVKKSMPRYCSFCGGLLDRNIVGAENVKDIEGFPMFSKFDPKTGKRNLVYEWKCLNAGIRLFTRHDWYEDSEIIK